MKYPFDLYNDGFTTKKPNIYANGKLVLWSMIDTIKPSISLLLQKNIKHIASANPKTAPYGAATEQVLKYYQILDSIKSKLVFGESIAQTNQFITTKAAEIGFTAKSVILSPIIKNKGSAIFIHIAKKNYQRTKGCIALKKNHLMILI